MFVAVASKIRRPSSPSRHTSAKSFRLGDCRAAVSRASSCRWVSPRVGDSAGTRGSADVLGRGVVEQAVDDGGAVEAGDDRGPAGDGGRLESADLLHPSQVELDLCPRCRQRIEAPFSAPGEVGAEVGLGVGP